MTSYVLRDDEGNVMRIVHRKEEAQCLIAMRPDWTFTIVRNKAPKVDLESLGPALF